MRSTLSAALLCAAAICVSGALSAAAADPMSSWTGCYLGANVGYGWGTKNLHGDPTDPDGFLVTKINPDGGLWGGQVGCDYQFDSDWVLGLQGSYDGASLTGSSIDGFSPPNYTDKARVNSLGSGTARIGTTALNPAVLFYVKGGVAWAQDKYFNSYYPIIAHQTRIGWTIGGGLEWMFCDDWSVFVEDDYDDFGTKIATYSPSPYVYHAAVSQTVDTLTVGVNLHL